MRRGIFGGTFNPVHFGHLRAAEEAREQLGLDSVIFIPCYSPPHKGAGGVTDPEIRLRMLEIATEGNPFFQISDIELKRGGRSYSIVTLKELEKLYGEREELFFIIGMDSFAEIGIWREYRELFRITDFAVVTRPGVMAERDPLDMLPVDIRDEFCYDWRLKKMKHISGRFVNFLETTLMDISSTRIRNSICDGRSVRYLMPEAVETFIRDKGLYRGEGK